MIKLDISGVRYNLDNKIRKYVNKKIGTLDRFIPKNARGSAIHGNVILEENSSQPKQRYKCEVKLHLPQGELYAKELTLVSMNSAIDQAEEKLVKQLEKYKTKKLESRARAQRFIRRFKRFGRLR